MSKIIVTGSTSFIGINLIKQLLENNHNVLAVIRENSNKKSILPYSEKLNVLELNMIDYINLNKVNQNYDVLVSLAWDGTRGNARENEELQHKNYRYCIDAIKSAIALGCKKIVLAGSQAEYGIHKDTISEKTMCHPKTQYGKYKLRLFLEVSDLCSKYNVKCIEPRFFSLYGPGDSNQTMIVSILKTMLSGEDCKLTLCDQFWNFMYISDSINALYKLIVNDVESGIYNLGSDDTRPLKDFIKEMKDITMSQSDLLFGYIPQQLYGAVNLIPDITKLKTTLKWSPSVNFKNGINKVIQDMKYDNKLKYGL